jgi:hypothetical protein
VKQDPRFALRSQLHRTFAGLIKNKNSVAGKQLQQRLRKGNRRLRLRSTTDYRGSIIEVTMVRKKSRWEALRTFSEYRYSPENVATIYPQGRQYPKGKYNDDGIYVAVHEDYAHLSDELKRSLEPIALEQGVNLVIDLVGRDRFQETGYSGYNPQQGDIEFFADGKDRTRDK